MTPNTIKRHIAEAIAALEPFACGAFNLDPAGNGNMDQANVYCRASDLRHARFITNDLKALLTEAETPAPAGSLTPGNDWREDKSETPAPGDDEIVEAVAMKLVEALSGKMTEYATHELRTNPKALEPFRNAARSVILRQAAQAATASTMRSAEEVRAEIERLGQAASFEGIGYLRALRWVLNEQET